MDRARGRGSSPVRDRLGPRADQFTGRGRTVGAERPRRPSRRRLRLRRSHPRRSRSPTDSRSGGLSSSRAGGSSWTSSVTSIPSAPRTPSTRARSPSMGARAATRSSMRARRACSSTCAVRSRAKSCGCTSRPTSTAAAMSFGCATRMGATVACWPGRPGRPSWTRTTCPTPSTSSRRWPSPRSGRRRCAGRRSWARRRRGRWRSRTTSRRSQSPDGVPGKAEYPMPDLATRLRFEGSRGHVLRVGLSRQGALPPDGGRAGRRDALGRQPVGEAEDVRPRLRLRAVHLRRRRRPLPRRRDRRARRERRAAAGRSRRDHGRLRALLVRPAARRTWSTAWRRRRTRTSTRTRSTSTSTTCAVNLLYWFLPNRAWAGVEYLYGRREVFGGQDRERQSASVRGSLQPPVVVTHGQRDRGAPAATRADRSPLAIRASWPALALLMLGAACGGPAATAQTAPAAGEWRTFEGSWTASGTRTTLDLGSDHRGVDRPPERVAAAHRETRLGSRVPGRDRRVRGQPERDGRPRRVDR